jgi:hypothetical protein
MKSLDHFNITLAIHTILVTIYVFTQHALSSSGRIVHHIKVCYQRKIMIFGEQISHSKSLAKYILI